MLDKAELEIEAKLQVRIGKALLRAKLITIGNALMMAWLVSAVLATIWYLAYGHAGASLSAMVAPLMGMSVEEYVKITGKWIGA